MLKKRTAKTTVDNDRPLEKPEPAAESEQHLLAEREEEILSLLDRLKRLQAEFDNYKKRILRETAILEERIVDREILEFLPLFDNMQRAFAGFSGKDDAESLIHGMERIFAQFEQILQRKGVCSIKAVNTVFDPNKHEAMLSVPSDEERNVVLDEFERGYMRSERVLRPCKVKVSSGKEEQCKEETE